MPSLNTAITKTGLEDPFDAEKLTLDEDKDTVAGRAKTIIAEDSPLMQQAATTGRQYANKRGLLNSSMGAQATQAAVMDRAIPMAQQDATTSFRAKELNQAATNTIGGIREQGRIESDLTTERGRVEKELKQGEYQQETSLLNRKAEIDKELLNADTESRVRLTQEQGRIDTDMLNLRINAEKGLADQSRALQLQMQGADLASRDKLAGEQRILDEKLTLAKLETDKYLTQISNDLQKELQVLRGTQAESIAAIESQYKQLMQSSDSAARLFVQTSADIGAILSNGEIELSAKQQLVDKQLELLQLGMDVFGAAAGVDYGDILNFDTAPGGP